MNNPTPCPCPIHPPGGDNNQNNNNNPVNNVIHNNHIPQMHNMTNAERIAVQSAYNEFMRIAHDQFGPIAAPFNEPGRLRLSILWALREIDSILAFGVNIAGIQQSEQHMRRLASMAYRGGMNHGMFDKQSFDVQLFFMNLVSFLLRYLNR